MIGEDGENVVTEDMEIQNNLEEEETAEENEHQAARTDSPEHGTDKTCSRQKAYFKTVVPELHRKNNICILLMIVFFILKTCILFCLPLLTQFVCKLAWCIECPCWNRINC